MSTEPKPELLTIGDQPYLVTQLKEHLPETKLPKLTYLQAAVLDWLIAYNRRDLDFCDGDVVADMHTALEHEGIDVDGILAALKAVGKDKVPPEPKRSNEIVRPGIATTNLPGGGTAYTKV